MTYAAMKGATFAVSVVATVACGGSSSGSQTSPGESGGIGGGSTASYAGGSGGSLVPGGTSNGDGGASVNTSSALPNSGGGVSGSTGASQPTLDLSYWDPKCGSTDAGPNAACKVCLLDSCKLVWDEAFGSNWLSGTPTGPCSSLLQCVRACTCGDSRCYVACASSLVGDASSNCAAFNRSAPVCSTSCNALCPASGGGVS